MGGYAGQDTTGFERLESEAGAPTEAFFTENDRMAALNVIKGKCPPQPVLERLSYLVEQGVYPGEGSQAAIYQQRIEGNPDIAGL